ncbi:class I SAM-dependent methyltransferase [bacterium]|nr:MAG: class I SAM-dependent methyltransferase [bacterium]
MIPWGERYNQSRRLIMRSMLHHLVSGRHGLVIADFGAQSINKLKENIIGRQANYAISEGVDTSANRVLNVDVNPENMPDILMNLEEPFNMESNYLDICIAGDIIEHLYTSRQFTSEIFRVLKSGGSLLISTPNMVSALRRIKWFFGGIPALASHADLMYGIDEVAPQGHGHIHDFNFRVLSSLLKRAGFDIVLERTDGIHIKNKLWIPALVIPMTLGDSIIIHARKP